MDNDTDKDSATRHCGPCDRNLAVSKFARNQRVCRECRKRLYGKAQFSEGRSCARCGGPVVNQSATGYCRKCNSIARRGTPLKDGRTSASGYVLLTTYSDHPNATARGHILEHILVMSQKLGRPLVNGENVHHINGIRDDNRPENLELWSTGQPKGQRVADKIAWAKEFLRQYEPEALSD